MFYSKINKVGVTSLLIVNTFFGTFFPLVGVITDECPCD
jgi:hypothetical protein